jgi:hypothetical protein
MPSARAWRRTIGGVLTSCARQRAVNCTDHGQTPMFLSHVHVESRFADFIQSSVERDFIGLVKVFVASDGGILAGKIRHDRVF